MKRKLIIPPAGNGDILFLPDPNQFISELSEGVRAGVCHQPYFFHPGISLKFIFLESFPKIRKAIIFLDTDKVNIRVKIPVSSNASQSIEFIINNSILFEFNNINEYLLNQFFKSIEFNLYNSDINTINITRASWMRFKEIFLKNRDKKFLKETLAESFLEYYQMEGDYRFLSDLLKGEEYKEFFLKIYQDAPRFRDIFNKIIDEYGKTFRFRYKNFPFPKLEEDELPFWIIHNGERIRCFKKDLEHIDLDHLTVFPRAATLTLFLRLYILDIFIHGIGGGNYEWVQDRIIERFFDRVPPPYAVISGTFLLGKSKERDLPYFLFPPENIKKRVASFMSQFT